jgi:hypothetical protein
LQRPDKGRCSTSGSIAGGPAIGQLSPDLHDSADAAAVLSLVDLVITTDASATPGRGAWRPAWVMLQFATDW